MPFTTFTLATLRTRLAERVESVAFFTEDDARDAINRSLRVWNLLTGTWRTRAVVAAVANQTIYSLPAMLSAPVRVSWLESPLGYSSWTDLTLARSGWLGETTASGGEVPTSPAVWAPHGLLGVALWPTPAAAGVSFVVDGVAATPVLTEAYETLDLDDGVIAPILDLALAFLAFRLGGVLLPQCRLRLRAGLQAALLQNDRLRASSAFLASLGVDPDRALRPRRLPRGPTDPREAAYAWLGEGGGTG